MESKERIKEKIKKISNIKKFINFCLNKKKFKPLLLQELRARCEEKNEETYLCYLITCYGIHKRTKKIIKARCAINLTASDFFENLRKKDILIESFLNKGFVGLQEKEASVLFINSIYTEKIDLSEKNKNNINYDFLSLLVTMKIENEEYEFELDLSKEDLLYLMREHLNFSDELKLFYELNK